MFIAPPRALAAAALALAVGATAAPRTADAVVTARWLVDDYEEFHEGEVDGARITSIGEIRPGFDTERVDLEFPNAWSAIRGPGGALYVGSDDDARVYTIEGDEVSELAAIPDAVAVASLALGDDGTLFAGTMPGGGVYAITPGGEVSELADLTEISGEDEDEVEVETVWSLAYADGRIFAGTGPSGLLVAIDPDTGAAEVAFDTEDKRIMSLATTDDGAVWLGTSEQARVFRHVPERGITRAMADFAGNEVTDLAPYRDGVAAAANQFEEPTTPRVKTAAAIREAEREEPSGEEAEMPEAGSQPGAERATSSRAQPQREGSRDGQGALFFVRGDSQLRQLHALTTTYISAVSAAPGDRIFVGAGEGGRVYLVDADESVSTALDVPQRIIAHLLWDDELGLGFTTADSTAFYRAAQAADTGDYKSTVYDTDAPSRLGRIAWRSEGEVTVETRSGNTAEPGPGWSAWEEADDIRNTGAGTAGSIASPPARYVQYRARFGDADAVLRRTLVYYLPQNRPTRVTAIEVDGHDPSDLVTADADSSSPRDPVVTVGWSVDNPDGDDTAYRLEARREGDARWRPLPKDDEPFTRTRYRWNTDTFPDGYYRLRVTASDRLENSPDRAQTHSKTSSLILVDNQKPVIEDIAVDYPSAAATARDELSPIAEMSYSVNDGPWQVGTTRDGLFDSRTETLALELPDDLESGEHVLAIRVADEAGNIASASATFEVP